MRKYSITLPHGLNCRLIATRTHTHTLPLSHRICFRCRAGKERGKQGRRNSHSKPSLLHIAIAVCALLGILPGGRRHQADLLPSSVPTVRPPEHLPAPCRLPPFLRTGGPRTVCRLGTQRKTERKKKDTKHRPHRAPTSRVDRLGCVLHS